MVKRMLWTKTLGLTSVLTLSSALGIVACSDDDGGSATDGVGGEAGAGGSAGAAGEPSASAGAGGEAGGGGCIELPESVTEDLTVGPGCVTMYRTSIDENATLTIAPGTTIQVESGGFLNVGVYGDASALVAKGTEEEPIVFTSAAASPAAGDWQCIRVEHGSAATELSYVSIDYAGSPCNADGAGIEGSLQIKSPARVDHVSVTHSSSHGIYIMPDGAVRKFEDLTFADNERESLKVSSKQLVKLGQNLTFEDDGERILIDNQFALGTSGTVLAQPVPFLVEGTLSIDDDAQVVFDAGLELQLDGGSVQVFNADLDVAGTADKPVRFTSAAATPSAGDWGCLFYDAPQGTATIEHAVFEYGGNGVGCTGAEYKALLVAPASATISNVTFSSSDDAGIIWACSDEPIPAGWCDNTFTDVTTPIDCTFGGPVSCE
ncbi:MAG TPA: hypothetical protein VHP33_26150 [Polyangiaceae bacterium]|nr:hypothetical protein [Polyangiaceae bacterium]